MAQRTPGILPSAETTRSRLRRNSATMRSTASCGPRNAATPASCTKAAVQEFELMTSLVSGSARRRGTTPKPRRQPVIAYALEKPSERMTRSRMPGSAAMERCGSS